MKTKWTWLIISVFMVAVLLASCGQKTTPGTSTPTTQTTTAQPTGTTTPTTATSKPTTPTTTVPTTTAGAPIYGGQITTMFASGFGSMDPGDGDANAKFMLNFVYNRLTMGDWAKGLGGTKEYSFIPSGSYSPAAVTKGAIAESWSMPDATTVVFKIRQGVRFGIDSTSAASQLVNGREIDANDVAYSANRYVAVRTAQLPARPYIDTIKATDKWTITLKLKTPYYDPVNGTMGFIGIHPKEVVDKYGSLLDWRNSVGSGPFMFTDFLADSSASFKKNPGYWQTDELNPKNQIPYVNTAKVLFIRDLSTMTAAFRSGKLDMAVPLAATVSQTLWDSIKSSNPGLKSVSQIQSQGYPRAIFRDDEAPFNNKNVRIAMVMAVDLKGIVQSYFKGNGDYWIFPCTSDYADLWRPLSAYPQAAQDAFTYNPTKAKQVLADAGFPNGLTVDLNTSQTFIDQSSILQAYWKAIGVTANIKLFDDVQLNTFKTSKTGWKGVLSSSAGWDYGPTAIIKHGHTGDASNSAIFSDPAVDKLLDDMAATSDPAQLKTKFFAAADLLMSQPPFLNFPSGYVYTVWQPWVQGYHGEFGLGGGQQFATSDVIARIWVDPSKK